MRDGRGIDWNTNTWVLLKSVCSLPVGLGMGCVATGGGGGTGARGVAGYRGWATGRERLQTLLILWGFNYRKNGGTSEDCTEAVIWSYIPAFPKALLKTDCQELVVGFLRFFSVALLLRRTS